MSADEGASWGAASEPTVAAVIQRQAILNPGKLPIHDLMLHAWIAAFGQSLTAMRTLSVMIDTISILLVFFLTCELFADAAGIDPALVAAIAALLFAVSIVTIKYSREARMYPVMLSAIVAQVWFFLRTLRRGGIANLIALAIFTAIGVGANFSALLVPAAEGLWLLCLLGMEGFRFTAPARRAWRAAIGLAIGGTILLSKVVSTFTAARIGTPGGIIRWINPPAWYEPFALFNKATGSFTFPALAILAAWAVYRGWRGSAREPIAFALLWMWAPPLMLMIASYTLTPLFVERYALSCFVPFFVLIAFGIAELPNDWYRFGALAIVVLLSLGHVWVYQRKSHDTQFAEATAAARASLGPSESITVVPAYAIEVVRYYLPSDERDRAIRYERGASSASVVLIGDQNHSPEIATALHTIYPTVVARFRGVVVFRK
jgi:mannosyltransferase